MCSSVVIPAAVEGIVDEAMVRVLLRHVGAVPGAIYGKQGKDFLRKGITGFNNAARGWPLVVLVDLDSEYDCAPIMKKTWVTNPAPYLCFRVAVREVESWVMADADRFAEFFSVPRTRIPSDPESIVHPKQAVIEILRRSRRKTIREDMLPRTGAGRVVGPAYSSWIIEFLSSSWRPHEAARNAPSLACAIRCLRQLARLQDGSL